MPKEDPSNEVTWEEPEDLKNENVDNDSRPDAYVTLCWDDSNILPTLVLFQQLRRVRSVKGEFAVMSNQLTAASIALLKKFGIKIYMIPSSLDTEIGYVKLSGVDLRDRDAILWTKLYVWALADYRKILLLDADMVILKNIDHLFEMPELAASPMITPGEKIMFYGPKPEESTTWNTLKWRQLKPEEAETGVGKIGLNSGLMILQPSLKRFHHMRALIKVLRHRPCCPTQEFIYRYFENLGKYHRLPSEYHVRVVTRMTNREEALELRKRAYVYHFVGIKPWKRDFTGIKDSYMLLWKAIADDISKWMEESSPGLPLPFKYAEPDTSNEQWEDIYS